VTLLSERSLGVLVPLFSLRSDSSWGIGEAPDLAGFADVARLCGASFVMTLPLLEPSPGLESPYSAGSFFALDPLYVSIDALPDFAAIGGEKGLSASERAELEQLRASPMVAHHRVRTLKEAVLRRCFLHARSLDAGSAAARDRKRFEEEHASWLPEYALFRALKHRLPESWRTWPDGVRTRHAPSLLQARQELADEVGFRSYLQWITFRQVEAARKDARARGVGLLGDEPFLVAEDSADVWSEQHLYRFDATVGAPPDAFSADGQEWGLPPYRWERLAEDGYSLFARRGAHAAKIYDAVRIDHVVGLYRTYHRPLDKSAHYFLPRHEPEQLAQGEAVLATWQKQGVELIAEDLGVIPDFVRRSLTGMKIPGLKVLRWEQEQGRFRDPARYPEISMATSGTHDTETSWQWWESLGEWERRSFAALPRATGLGERTSWGEDVWKAVLDVVLHSASRTALLPLQDLLSLRPRINTPNTMGPENWSWRTPWTNAGMASDAIVRGRLEAVRAVAQASGRAR
jgi:4-alpha-glucanotransferase